MAYTLDNLRTDIRNYTEVDSGVLSDSVLDTMIKNTENKIQKNPKKINDYFHVSEKQTTSKKTLFRLCESH